MKIQQGVNKLKQLGNVDEYQKSFEELKAFMVVKNWTISED